MIDSAIQKILDGEEFRQKHTVELIASENYASDEVRSLCGSIFTNKYAEGLPYKRFYNGCQYADDIELLAIDYATRLLDVNMQMYNRIVERTQTLQCLKHF